MFKRSEAKIHIFHVVRAGLYFVFLFRISTHCMIFLVVACCLGTE